MAKNPVKRVPTRLMAEVGTSGLQHSGGQILAEFDADLRGIRGIRIYEEMRRSDPTVAVGLRAVGWTLGQVQWRVEAGGDASADKDACCFLESCMDDMSITWSKLVRDALTCLPFGFAWLEGIYKQRVGSEADPPSRYDDGRIGWRKWTLIGHESLGRWDIDDDGGIRAFVQAGWMRGGDRGYLGDASIPIEKSILFRLDDERNNPEGVSLLRPIYLPWWKKKNIEEIEAIGIERDLTGVLIIRMPVGATSADQQKARDLLEQFKADDMSGFTAPRNGSGDENTWTFEIINSPGSKAIDPGKAIERYQLEIARSFLAQFLMLGQGETGSRAVGSVQRDMFETALGAILRNFEETINRFMVPPLFRLNEFGGLTALPKIVAGRISRSDAEKLANALKNLTDSGHLTPNRETERFLREELELPALPEDVEQTPKEETGSGGGGGVPREDKQVRTFAEDDSLDVAAPYSDGDEDEINRLLRKLEEQIRPKGLSEPYRYATPNRNRIDLGKLLSQHMETTSRHLGELAANFREGRIKYDQWAAKGKTEIEQSVRMAQKIGLAQARGVWPPSSVKLTNADRVAANAMVDEQLTYFSEFRKQIRETIAAGKELTTALDARAKSYVGMIKSASSQAAMGEQSGASLVWVRHKDDSCETCLGNEGAIKTAREWTAGGVWPAHGTICHGNCGCSLEPAATGKRFHQPGKHDQKSHGFGGGSFEDLSEKAYETTISNLSEDERNGVIKYTGGSFISINRSLRNGEMPRDTLGVPAIDRALEQGSAPKNFIAYRGISDATLAKIGVGTEFVDHGFVSTSISESTAKRMGANVLTVNVPKGSKGLYVESITKNRGEYEFLIPRNSRFRIDSKSDIGIRATLMP